MIKTELEALRNKGQLRSIPNIQAKSDGRIIIDGIEYINFASMIILVSVPKQNWKKNF